MNRIYKVIWSKVKHQYVVTSEFAHSCTKSTTSRVGKSAVAALAAFVLTAGVGGVQAAEYEVTVGDSSNTTSVSITEEELQEMLSDAGIPVGTVNGEHSIAIGEKSRVKDGSQFAMAIGYDAMAAKDNTLAFGTSAAAGSKGAIAIGTHAKANYGLNAMAIGNYSTATGEEAIAAGKEATAGGDYSVAIGAGSDAAADNSIAIGKGAKVEANQGGNADNSIALGVDSLVTGNHSVALGSGARATNSNATAIGDDSHATGGHSSAFGQQSHATAESATALGYNARATAKNSVALGAGSIADEEGTISVGRSVKDSPQYDFQRRITDVAAGINDFDAVNVKQMKDAVTDATVGAGMVQWDSTTDETTGEPTYHEGMLKGVSFDGEGSLTASELNVKKGEDTINVGKTLVGYENAGIVAGGVSEPGNGIALGSGSSANAGSIAIGDMAWVMGKDSIGLGNDISVGGNKAVAIGSNILSVADNSVALGYGSAASRANTVSVGSSGNERQITNVAAGTEDTDAVNVGQLNERFSSYEDGGVVAGTVKDGVNNSIAVGEGSYVGSNQSTALGEYAMISDTAEQSVALGTHALVYSANSVALGYNSVADRANTVSVGSAGNERQITNVAAGTERTDAVNVGQLQDALSNVGIDAEGGNVVQADKDGNVTIDGNLDVNGGLTVGDTVISGEDLAGVADISGIKTDVKTNASNITALQDKVGSGDINVKDANGSAVTNLTDAVNANYTQIQNNSNAINTLGHRVSDLGDEIDSVGAISAALAGLHPLDYDGTGSKFQISAAMGTYDGTQAAAIGGFYHFNRDVMMSLGGATSFEGDKKTAANIGVTFRVGEGASGKSVSDDVMARLEAMDQKIAALEQENKELKNVLGAIDTSLSKEFPDVPANHWAYEAVTKLAGNDVVAGYPDGEFHGDRTMTRYEMAEIIYKAMNRGAQVDQKLVEEFKPEMEQVAANTEGAETTPAAAAETAQPAEENA